MCEDELPYVSVTLPYLSNSGLVKLRDDIKNDIKSDPVYKEELGILLNSVLKEMASRLYSE